MLINRDNYETYFLMYADNELTAAEREAVEVFATANNDLGEELKLLLATILPAEETEFTSKTLLYRNSDTVKNVEESLLLYLDKELSPAGIETLEKEIAQNEQVREEWQLLQKTRLDEKDVIVFNDKRSLYRHTGKLVAMRYWRIAAAAVFTGFCIFLGSYYVNKDLPVKEMDVANKNAGIKKVVPLPVKNPGKEKEIKSTNNDVAIDKRELSGKPKNIANSDLNIKKTGILHNEENMLGFKNINMVQSNEVVKGNVKIKEVSEVARSSDQRDPVINERLVLVTPSEKVKEITKPVFDPGISDGKQSFGSLAVNENARSNDHILFMEEEKISKSKIGTLFRKMKRVVERNTKIKTANGFRIGGFEFAVK